MNYSKPQVALFGNSIKSIQGQFWEMDPSMKPCMLYADSSPILAMAGLHQACTAGAYEADE